MYDWTIVPAAQPICIASRNIHHTSIASILVNYHNMMFGLVFSVFYEKRNMYWHNRAWLWSGVLCFFLRSLVDSITLRWIAMATISARWPPDQSVVPDFARSWTRGIRFDPFFLWSYGFNLSMQTILYIIAAQQYRLNGQLQVIHQKHQLSSNT